MMVNSEKLIDYLNKGYDVEVQNYFCNLLDQIETKQLALIFKNAMESSGIKKMDRRKKDNRNTYYYNGDCTAWNRVECMTFKDSSEYGNEDLEITLRKRSGYYLLIERKGNTAIEVSWCTNSIETVNFDKNLLIKVLRDYSMLFDLLLQSI